MKIIINAFQYSSAITGTDRMAHNYLVELQKIDKKNQYFIVCSGENYNQSIVQESNFKIIRPSTIPGGKQVQRAYNKVWRTLLPYRLRLLGSDVYLSFHNMSLPNIKVAKRLIAFNLDLIPIKFKEYASIHNKTTDKVLTEYRRIVSFADHFVSISRFSKSELCEELEVKPDDVTVIHLAGDPDFVSSRDDSKLPAESGKYLLTVGGTEPRKNVKTVVDAFTQLPDSLQNKFPLVVVGGEWRSNSLSIFSELSNVTCLGYVDDSALKSLYKNSTAFVFASKYEGFGFTILEAMASGTPVINARGSSLDEVAGNATLSFDPKDASALASQITRLLSDKDLRDRLVKLGYQQNKKFSWGKAAAQLHQVLTKI